MAQMRKTSGELLLKRWILPLESASKSNSNILKQQTTPKSVQSDKTKVKIIKNSTTFQVQYLNGAIS